MRKEMKIALLTVISVFIWVGIVSVKSLFLGDKNPFQKQNKSFTQQWQNNISDDLQANLNTTNLKSDLGQVMGEEDSEIQNGGITRDGKQETFYLVINASDGGSSTPSDGYHQYAAGSTVSYTFTAKEGFLIDSLKIKGVTIWEAAGQATYSGTVTMNSDYIFEIVFASRTTSHDIQYESISCGTISGPSSAVFGDTVSFDVVHSDTCWLVSLKYSSPTFGEHSLNYEYGKPVTFSMPNSDTIVTAVFEPEADCGGNNVIVENGSGGGSCIYEGSEVTVRPLEIYGKRFARWTSDDITITDPTNPVLTFTTPIPGRDIRIVAVFEDLPKYTVTLNCPPADQLEPAGCLNYEPTRFVGENVYFNIRPKVGYYVHKVIKNGETFYGPVDLGPHVDGSYTNDTYIVTENLNFSFELKKALFPLHFGGDGTHGNITPNVTKAGVGDEVTFAVSPQSGYRLKRAYVAYGVEADYTEVDITSTLKFTMPADTVTYYAEFEIVTNRSLQVGCGLNGTCNISNGTHVYEDGETVELRIMANSRYVIGTVVDNGVTVSIPPYQKSFTYSINMNMDHIVTVGFERAKYSLQSLGSSNGSVVPSESLAYVGDVIDFSVTADEGYELASLYYMIEESSEVHDITETKRLVMPEANVSYGAEFRAMKTLKIDCVGLGLCSPESGTYLYKTGSKITFSARADTESYITSVVVDGVPVTLSPNQVDFQHEIEITESTHRISVRFDGNKYTITPSGVFPNGYVVPSLTSALPGEEIVLYTFPDFHYFLSSLSYREERTGVVHNIISPRSFIMPSSNIIYTAQFEEEWMSIDPGGVFVACGLNGICIPGHGQSLLHTGEVLNVKAIANEGYVIDKFIVKEDEMPCHGQTVYEVPVLSNLPTVPVKITFAKKKYNIAYNNATNGNITGVDKASEGDTVQLQILPDAGYRLKEGSLFYSKNDSGEAYYITGTSFAMPNGDITINFEFEEISASSYNIVVSSGVANYTTAPLGTIVGITANEALEGKDFDKWTSSVAGVVFEDRFSPTTTFSMVNRDVVISANYKNKQYAFSFNCGANGKCEIAPNQAKYEHGSTVTLNITPNTGYTIKEVVRNGIAIPEYANKGAVSISTVVLGETFVQVTFTEKTPASGVPKSPESLIALSLTVFATQQNGTIVATVSNVSSSFVGRRIELWLNSDPVKIGEFTVIAGKTDYELRVQIPCFVPVGTHTAHLKLDGVTVGNSVSLAISENSICRENIAQKTTNLTFANSGNSASDLSTTGIDTKLLFTIVGSLVGLGFFIIIISKRKKESKG